MSDLDQELERAIQESEAEAKARAEADSHRDTPPVAAAHPETDRPRRNVGLLVALLVAMGGILSLVLTSFDDAAIYSVPVHELMGKSDEFADRNVRVEGVLVKGSLQHRAEPCEYRFRIEKGGKELPVRYAQCVVPDTFRDVPNVDVEVTAEGKLVGDGSFEASQIMAKCPSKYEMEQKAKAGEQAPHALYGDPAGAEAVAVKAERPDSERDAASNVPDSPELVSPEDPSGAR